MTLRSAVAALFHDLIHLNRDLRLLALALFLWGIGEGIFFYYQPLYLAELGASPGAIGGILGVGGLVLALSHLPAGWLADRLGRRQLMWASWGTGLLAAWLMTLAPNLTVFAVGVVLYFASGFVVAPMNSYLTVARGALPLERVLTLVPATFNAGAVLGPLIGGLLVERLPMRMLYGISAGLFTLSTLLVFLLRPQPVVSPDRQAARSRHLRWSPHLLSPLVLMGLTSLTLFFAYLPQPLAPNYLVDFRRVSRPAIGGLGAFTRLGVVVLNLGLGRLNARTGYLLAQGALGVAALLVWRGNALPFYQVAFFLLGAQMTLRALAASLVRPFVSEANMGLLYGLLETVNSLPALALAPAVAGMMYTLNPHLLWPLAGGVVLALTPLSALWLFRTPAFRPRPLESSPAPSLD